MKDILGDDFKPKKIIRVFKINEFATFAGATIKECIEEGKLNYDEEYDESEAYQITEEEMRTLKVYDEDSDRTITYADFLAEMIEEGQDFPCLFCHTEL